MRFQTLDGLRGILLTSMTITHFKAMTDNPLIAKVGYTRLGYVDAAHGFLFLSGMLMGFVFGARLIRKSADAMLTGVRRRFWTVAGYHAALTIAVTICVAGFAVDTERLQPQTWGDNAWLAGGLALMTMIGPRFFDILPMYLVFIAFAPLALMQMHKGRHLFVIGVSLALWTVSQLGISGALMDAAGGLLGLQARGMTPGLFFDRMGWQLVFFAGLTLGMLLAQGKLDPTILAQPQFRLLQCVAVALVLMFAVLKIGQSDGFLPASIEDRIHLQLDKGLLGAVAIVNLAADVYVIAWLLTVGRHESSRMARIPGRFLNWLANCRYFVFVGQHSLQVFSFHVLLYYMLRIFAEDRIAALPPLGMELLAIAICMSLLVPAWLHLRWQRMGRPAPAAPPASPGV